MKIFRTEFVKPSEIIIGERIRKDLGDIEELKKSIEKFGLLQPIGITSSKKLVYGERRLTAWKALKGDEPIECRIIDDEVAEIVENIHRKQLTWVEEVKAIEALHKKMEEKAKELAPVMSEPGKVGRPPKPWTQQDTADLIGVSQSLVNIALSLSKTIEERPEILQHKTLEGAMKYMQHLKKKEEMTKVVTMSKEEMLSLAKNPVGQIICGDAYEVLKNMPSNSVHLVVFSPPYWGHRDYGVEGQIGLEPLNDYVNKLVKVCDEIWRVLRDDGSMYINIGDTYGGSMSTYKKSEGVFGIQKEVKDGYIMEGPPPQSSAPKKCKMLVPYRVAIALIDRGWICRNDIIWAKQVLLEDNTTIGRAMPSGATDRLNNVFEPVFHFVKQEKYYYNMRAISAKISEDGIQKAIKLGLKEDEIELLAGKNPGDVWLINPARDSPHPAAYPEELVSRIIKASTPEYVCGKCGAPYIEVVESERLDKSRDEKTDYLKKEKFLGYTKSCKCETNEIKRAVVLDPFVGGGTTVVAAYKLGRDYIGIDINPEFVSITKAQLERCKSGGENVGGTRNIEV